MFDRIREDFDVHGRSWSNRAWWAMVHFRYGQWSAALQFPPFRWFNGKIYGFFAIFMPILTGVFLNRGTRVGRRFHLIHPGMVVISPRSTFGDRCGLMHNVTIGMNMQGGVPTIGDDVFIGAGAVVIGEIHIGKGVRIAANSLVIADVPANSLAMGVPAKIYPNMGQYAAKTGSSATSGVTSEVRASA